ncbi:hypothetical protein NDU88_004137 [Pleurodeles waltl]|uniref:Uncharacterized protein n=1 Tax=Pleurodeles waltl TaxID=8319 RepID=A0AAV7RKM1_PLEWA|nr:hypothetical protein NDU88_004137 [Pleurodeles waltl]
MVGSGSLSESSNLDPVPHTGPISAPPPYAKSFSQVAGLRRRGSTTSGAAPIPEGPKPSRRPSPLPVQGWGGPFPTRADRRRPDRHCPLTPPAPGYRPTDTAAAMLGSGNLLGAWQCGLTPVRSLTLVPYPHGYFAGSAEPRVAR